MAKACHAPALILVACSPLLERWHRIPRGRALTDAEVDALARLVMAWIERDLVNHPVHSV